MATNPQPALQKRGGVRSILQTVVVLMVLVALATLYWKASGGKDSNDINSHRIIIAECWKTVGRDAPSPEVVKERQAQCERMERGFARMYGSGA